MTVNLRASPPRVRGPCRAQVDASAASRVCQEHQQVEDAVRETSTLQHVGRGVVRATARDTACMRAWPQENITSYIKAARAFGQIPFEMFSTEDLASKKNLKSVISSLHSLGRRAQQARPDIKPRLGIAVTKGVRRTMGPAVLPPCWCMGTKVAGSAV